MTWAQVLARWFVERCRTREIRWFMLSSLALRMESPTTYAHVHVVPRAAISFPEAAILLVSDRARYARQSNADSGNEIARAVVLTSFLSSEPCAESDKNKIMQINGKKEGSSALVPKKGRGWERASPSRAVWTNWRSLDFLRLSQSPSLLISGSGSSSSRALLLQKIYRSRFALVKDYELDL